MFGNGPQVPQISAQELAEKLEKEQAPVIVDVREPEEFAEGHIPGARLIPLGTVPDRLGEIPKDQDVVVVCKAGGRSTAACQHLLAAGYQRIQNLTGGMMGWTGPVER